MITGTLYKIRQAVGQLRFRDRTRSVRRRVLQIVLASRKVGRAAQREVKGHYRRLMGTGRAVLRQAQRAVASAQQPAKKLAPALRQQVRGLAQQAKQMSRLTQRILEQTRARVLKGIPITLIKC